MGLHGSVGGQLRGVDAVRGAELARDVELGGVDVDREDPRGLALFGALDDGQAHGAEAEDRHGGALLDVAGLPGGAQAGTKREERERERRDNK